MATKDQKLRGMSLLIESLHKPDDRLRCCAHNQECFYELMAYRDEVIAYCQNRLKEIEAE
jgi:disulfide oxidoreductase YuzD